MLHVNPLLTGDPRGDARGLLRGLVFGSRAASGVLLGPNVAGLDAQVFGRREVPPLGDGGDRVAQRAFLPRGPAGAGDAVGVALEAQVFAPRRPAAEVGLASANVAGQLLREAFDPIRLDPSAGRAFAEQALAGRAVKWAELTDGVNIAVDAARSNNFRVTLAGNRTLDNPTGLLDGQPLEFRVQQDATGGRTLAFGSKFKFPGGVAPTLTAAANAVDWLRCLYDSTSDTVMCQALTADIK